MPCRDSSAPGLQILDERPVRGSPKCRGGACLACSFASHKSRVTEPDTMNKLTINDLDLRGKRVFIRVDFNVRSRTASSLMTPASRNASDTAPCDSKGARLVLLRTSDAPRAAPTEIFSGACRQKLEELLANPVRLRSIASAPVRRPEQSFARRRSVGARKRPFHPKKKKTMRPFQNSSPLSATAFSSAMPSVPRIARMLPLSASRASSSKPLPACLWKRSSRISQSGNESRAPFRCHSWRRQGQRQNRSHRKPHENCRRHAHWRWHGLHLSQSRGPAHRQVARRR